MQQEVTMAELKPGLTDASLHFYDPELPSERQASTKKALQGSDGVWNGEGKILCPTKRSVLGGDESQKFSSEMKIMNYVLKWNFNN